MYLISTINPIHSYCILSQVLLQLAVDIKAVEVLNSVQCIMVFLRVGIPIRKKKNTWYSKQRHDE